MILYDVSLPISDELPIWPGDPGISMTLSNSLSCGDAANVTRLTMGVHTGTHIDAPCHFEPGGISIDKVSLDVLMGPCRVFDLTGIKESIGRSDLEKLDFAVVVRVLLKTRNSEWWARGEKKFQKQFIHLREDGAGFLLERGVKLVGVDYLSVERFKSPDHATHQALLRREVVIVEGLDLNAVPAGDYELFALPIKLKGADGAPTRVVLRTRNG